MPTLIGEKKQLTTLVGVSQALAGTLHLEASLHRVLELLEHQQAMFPSIVTLLQGKASELTIAAAHGLTERGKQTRYRLGEGITGRVAESGKPIIVPRVSHEPMFLNRAGERKIWTSRIAPSSACRWSLTVSPSAHSESICDSSATGTTTANSIFYRSWLQ